MATKEEKAAAITEYLANCNGFEDHYQHWMRRGSYSAGVKFVADTAGAYWLIDAVFSHVDRFLLNAGQGFIVWKLTLNKTGSGAKLEATDGGIGGAKERVLKTQRIPFTDFPLKEITLYLENSVLMLAEER